MMSVVLYFLLATTVYCTSACVHPPSSKMFYLTFFSAVIDSVAPFAWLKFVLGWIVEQFSKYHFWAIFYW
jgi:hypothetical protein